jgi:beta-galactosidase
MKQQPLLKKLRLLAAGTLVAFAGLAGAQTRQPLDAGWEYYQGSLGSTWEIWRVERSPDTHDNVSWTPVTLPHCFNERDAVDPDAHYYQGPGWYRTRLKLANPYANGRTLLHFDGAGQKAQVFVGLKKVGDHVGGFDGWDVDITAAAAAETNGDVRVAVQCDNSRDAETIPSDLSDFNRYGGLYRHVTLVYVPALSLERVHVEPVLGADGNATVKVRARLYNPAALKDELQLAVEIRDANGKVLQSATQKLAPWEGEKELAALALANPQRWSPKSPTLYTCNVSLQSAQGAEQETEKFGVRSLEWVEHGPFLLNGERLALHGTHYHEDHAGVAAAVPDAVVRQTLQAMKAMGVNFVRLGHYQQAPLVLELCDELGILAWEEDPWCRGGIGGERYRQQCRDMLTHMIDQHYNHPAIILWGLGNENDWPGDFETFDTNGIRNFMAEQNALAHRLDPSRKTVIRRCEFCKDIPDVYSPSLWPGWYSSRYNTYASSLAKGIAGVPHFFHAEFGGDSHARRHAEDPEAGIEQAGAKARPCDVGDWSETYIINLFDWYLKEQETMTNLTGAAQWIFKDFATPLRPQNPVPRVNQKGVVERDGTLKESYYVFQSYWSDQPMLHIYGHTWPVRWGKAGEEKAVKVFSNCREVELFVNGVSAGVKQRNSTNYPAAGLCWQVKFDEGTNTLRAVAHTAAGDLTDEISQEYQTATWGEPAGLVLRQVAATNDVCTLEVRAFDKEGVPCLDAANVVRFGLTGDGRLIDNLGTSTGSRVVQLYNGRAQISVRLTGHKAVASVKCEGLPTQFLSVTSDKWTPAAAPKNPKHGVASGGESS